MRGMETDGCVFFERGLGKKDTSYKKRQKLGGRRTKRHKVDKKDTR